MFKADADDDHLYDFNTNVGGGGGGTGVSFNAGGRAPQTGYRAPTSSARVSGVPGSSMGKAPGSRAGLMTGAAGGGGGDARPMTSVSGAGYKGDAGKEQSKGFDPLQMGKGPAPPLHEKSENSPEDKAKEMERNVHRLIEESADAVAAKDMQRALDKAKEAGKAERAMVKFRESHSLTEQLNLDLTYAICFNLANAYHHNSMYDEAINTYQIIVKNKEYPQSGRLRVNMGNIYYEQKKYPQAIKQYRMALDQIPSTGRELRFRIFRNIGNAFIKMGQFQDAIDSFESVMSGSPDMQTAFNLMMCLYARGDKDKMRKHFTKMLTIPISGMTEEEEERLAEGKQPESVDDVLADRVDTLRDELRKRHDEANEHLLTSARLIAPVIDDEEDWEAGYKWVMDKLKPELESVASKLELDMSMAYMNKRRFEDAIGVLKGFERKDSSLRAMAATNLSFIYFLEGDYQQAEKHADVALKADRYSARALVNKGNCLYMAGELARAKEMYLEAVGVEADCIEGIYNLGLVNLKCGSLEEAHQAFDKLHTILPTVPEALFQLGAIYEQGSTRTDWDQAAKTYEMLLHKVPGDPGVCARLGTVFEKLEDDASACHWHMEAHRHYPVNLNVISWLGVWYVKREMLEQAIEYFERASVVQPGEIKWRLMITSCYRRLGDFHKALELYQQIHEDYPDNLEALQYLEALCRDLGRPYEEYSRRVEKLRRLQPAQPMPAQASQAQAAPQQAQRAAPQRPDRPQRSERPTASSQGQATPSASVGPSEEKERDKDRSPLAAPRAGASVPTNRPAPAQRPTDDDDDFGDTDVGELLG